MVSGAARSGGLTAALGAVAEAVRASTRALQESPAQVPVFTALAVYHQKSPPTINIFKQDPECDLDYCANTARDMKMDVALKNNFGFGGTNGSLVFKRV